MVLKHVFGLLVHPRKEWNVISSISVNNNKFILINLLLLAMIPGVSAIVGNHYFGWSNFGDEPVKLSSLSASFFALVSWFSIILGTVFLSLAIHWMEKTYECNKNYMDCFSFSVYVCIPLFFTGLGGVFPSITLSIFVILLGIAWSAYLLYLGLPIFMGISRERGFMFATSIVCIGLVFLVSMKVLTILLWEYVLEPEFIM